ncbi:Retrovirus-related Pol polyprotein from transposon TNT 1-94 [Trichinella sp. T9]|nr:Retrovirus-related Pol polyprotein from transposon TNT 1-94 [Trichinella sp. T9]
MITSKAAPVDEHLAYKMEKKSVLKKRSAEQTKPIPAIYDEEASAASAVPSTSGYFPLFKRVKSTMYCHRGKRYSKFLNHRRDVQIPFAFRTPGIKVHAQEHFCTDCVLGKHHREGFQSRKYRARAPGKLIHVDLCGPMHVTSLGGSKYFLIFKDDFSRYRQNFFLKKKDDVAQCLETFLDESRTAGNTVECILSDGGLKFNNAHVKDILQRRSVAMLTAMPYTPEHDGVAERENRILVETGKSQIELWFKRHPVSIDHFHGFGTECFVHVPKQLQRKWEKKSVAGRLMGYCDEKDGYRIWLPDINQIVTSRGVLFKPQKICLPSQMSVKAVSSEKNEDEGDSDAEELRLELNSQWTSKEAKCEVETKMEREEEKSEQASRSNKQEEVALSSKQVKYEELQQRITALTAEYNGGTRTLEQFLRAVAYLVPEGENY